MVSEAMSLLPLPPSPPSIAEVAAAPPPSGDPLAPPPAPSLSEREVRRESSMRLATLVFSASESLKRASEWLLRSYYLFVVHEQEQ